MAKFRKKPVVIEAIQYNGLNREEIEKFVGQTLVTDYRDAAYKAGAGAPVLILMIPTLESPHEANPRDWIIKGVNGEFYPCKPDIFEKTYALADESETILEPKIKPLEWIEEDTFVAFGSFGTFEVMESLDPEKPWTGSLNDANQYDGFEEQNFATVEEAKAYCNTLHEKQIREALKFVEAYNVK